MSPAQKTIEELRRSLTAVRSWGEGNTYASRADFEDGLYRDVADLSAALSELESARALVAEFKAASEAMLANMHVSEGGPKSMRGVWFRGGDAVAQVESLRAALAKTRATK